jgi:Flp pilus assembly protein TadB
MTAPALVFGTLIGTGILLVVLGVTVGPREAVARPSRAGGRLSRLAPAARRTLLIAVPAGLLAFLVTGWIAWLVLVPAAAVGLPALLRPAATGTPIAVLEALEEWTRGLAGVLTVGAGLEQALITSARSAPEPIRPQVTALAARLHSRTPTEVALRAFADDLNDATADLVVLSLTLAASKRGMGLAPALTSLSRSVAKDVANRRAVEADRVKLRTTTRTITGLTLVMMGGLFLSGDYIAPYRTGVGMLALFGLIGAYAATLAWMKALGAAPVPSRLIVDRAS